MKKYIKFTVMMIILLLGGCSLPPVAEDTIDEVYESVQQDIVDAHDDLNIDNIFLLKSNEEQLLDKHFSGTIYIMANKEQITHHITEAIFSIGNQNFDTIIENSEDDFNIRYNGKTYFTIKLMTVTDLDKITIKSDWKQYLVLVTRAK